MNNSEKTYTLITGAGSGIGRALAVNAAQRGWNLILIALPGEGLDQLSEKLKKEYKIDVRFSEMDLTEPEAPLKVYRWCQNRRLKVNRLVNNAGVISSGRPFEEDSYTFYEKMIGVNVVAVTLLTRVFLPELKKHSHACILNVGSTGSFIPFPYKTVYGATKSFIYSFTMALREELRESQVKVSALCPGSIPTNRKIRKRTEKAGWLWKISILQADQVARIGLDSMEKNRRLTVPGCVNKFYKNLCLILPIFIKMRIMTLVFKKMISQSLAHS
ncbi:MAG: SDR family NAD(P)-dependent oxidoreductase [Candidatus Aminicenantes bacterium]|nr:SDR family NAD(P)-dependent oxidoreductase [Candidatus Aminicenantes bacterium]